MSDVPIPEDVQVVADRIVWGDMAMGDLKTAICEAILAERDRCAKIAEHGVKWSPPIGGGVERWVDESTSRIAAAIRRGTA